MSYASVDGALIQRLIRNCNDTLSKIEKTKQTLTNRYQALGATWSDSKYHQLGAIVDECNSAIGKVSKELQGCVQKLEMLNVHIKEYESVNFTGGGGSGQGGQGRQIPQSSSGTSGGGAGSAGGQTLDTISSWLSEINPNYTGSRFSPYSSNCGSCALAVFQRLSGNSSATATPQTLSIEEMNQATGRTQTAMTPGQIADHLRSQGAGSFGVVGVDRSSGPGHWFNAYFDGQDVHAIDGQTGQIHGWPPDYGDVVFWDFSV